MYSLHPSCSGVCPSPGRELAGPVDCRLQAGSPGQLVLKCPKHPEDFQGKVYKDRVREGDCDTCDQFVDILLIGEVIRS